MSLWFDPCRQQCHWEGTLGAHILHRLYDTMLFRLVHLVNAFLITPEAPNRGCRSFAVIDICDDPIKHLISDMATLKAPILHLYQISIIRARLVRGGHKV